MNNWFGHVRRPNCNKKRSNSPPLPLKNQMSIDMDFTHGAAVETNSTNGGHVEQMELEAPAPLQVSGVNNQHSMRSTETVTTTINTSPGHILVPEKSAAVARAESIQHEGKSIYLFLF